LEKANGHIEDNDGSEDAALDEVLDAKAEAHGEEEDLRITQGMH
jgi:hypothetical protein